MAIAGRLRDIAASVRIVDLPAELPAGWDLADPVPKGIDVAALIEDAPAAAAEPEAEADGPDDVEQIVTASAADPGSAFEPEALDFLGALRARDPAAWQRTRQRLKDAKVRVSDLERELSSRKRRSKGRSHQSDQENQGLGLRPRLSRSQSKRSQSISRSESVLDGVAKVVKQLGAAGVRDEAKILYLAITTRLLDRPFPPAHVLVKGASAGGKNYLVDTVARLFPESAIYKMTGMSDRALAYLGEPMAHRFIILAEAAAIEDSPIALALVRSLLSEGELRYPTVEKDPETGQLATITKHLEGPTG
jgi:hypothetical protein